MAEGEDARSGAGPGARFQECRALGYIKNVNTKEVKNKKFILTQPACCVSRGHVSLRRMSIVPPTTTAWSG